MKKLLLPLLLLTLSPLAFSQSRLPDGLKVNGVALNSRYADIIKKFGKPTRDVTSRKIDECIGSRTRTLYYPGLKFELVENERNVFEMFSFEVTSQKWELAGPKIGDSTAAIQKLFGTGSRSIDKVGPDTVWFYTMTDESPGSTNFYFRGGKLVKIITGYEMC